MCDRHHRGTTGTGAQGTNRIHYLCLFFCFFWSSLCPFQVKHFVSTFWFVGLDLDLISENRGEGKFYKYELNINFLSFIKNNMRLH